MSHVFISYVRENSMLIDKLTDTLKAHGVEIWLDRNKIKPGYRWKNAIRQAISDGAFFMACFSKEYEARTKSFVNEELTLAIDELRQRPTDQAWFIPVLLSPCNVPDRDIGGGETLRDINWVALYDHWDAGIQSILSVIEPAEPKIEPYREGAHADKDEEEAQPRVVKRTVLPQAENDAKPQESRTLAPPLREYKKEESLQKKGEKQEKRHKEHRGSTVFHDTLKDGSQGPEMVVIPSGAFWMGSVKTLDSEAFDAELPRHLVTIAKPFALGRYPVTFDEYDHFARATDRKLLNDKGWGRGNRPVFSVLWADATAYTAWLSAQTGKRYRLPTEAEWEYAARAGTETRYWWGDTFERNRANCFSSKGWKGIWQRVFVTGGPAPVGSFKANPFGLYDTAGNVWEWMQDCWHWSYEGAPTDGSAWLEQDDGDCGRRVLRGGAWSELADRLRSAIRIWYTLDSRFTHLGFRLAQDL